MLLATRIPLVGEHRPAGERLESDRRDETGRRLGHHHLHGGTFPDQQANQFGRLVGSDAAGDAKDDVFSCQFHALGSSTWLE
jgi:hypothetical protein